VSERDVALARNGLEAWRRGDLDTLEKMLAPEATWRWFEPGDWDCDNREEILGTLRERYEQGFGRGEIDLVDAGAGAVVAVSRPREVGGDEWPEETATVLAFREDKIVSMQDYRTRDDAIAAVG
jgi:ketosteroid isomerase-like protein